MYRDSDRFERTLHRLEGDLDGNFLASIWMIDWHRAAVFDCKSGRRHQFAVEQSHLRRVTDKHAFVCVVGLGREKDIATVKCETLGADCRRRDGFSFY